MRLVIDACIISIINTAIQVVRKYQINYKLYNKNCSRPVKNILPYSNKFLSIVQPVSISLVSPTDHTNLPPIWLLQKFHWWEVYVLLTLHIEKLSKWLLMCDWPRLKTHPLWTTDLWYQYWYHAFIISIISGAQCIDNSIMYALGTCNFDYDKLDIPLLVPQVYSLQCMGSLTAGW